MEEGDDIVLHPFEAGASGPMSRWVFNGIEKDAYHWYGETSSDRGKTWTKTWLIDVERKSDEPASPWRRTEECSSLQWQRGRDSRHVQSSAAGVLGGRRTGVLASGA